MAPSSDKIAPIAKFKNEPAILLQIAPHFFRWGQTLHLNCSKTCITIPHLQRLHGPALSFVSCTILFT